MQITRQLTVLALCGFLTIAVAQTSATEATQDSVYGALFALMQFPKSKARIYVLSETQDTGCGQQEADKISLNGCGIWTPPATESSVHHVLRRDWPELQETAWSSFITQNRTSGKLDLHSAPPANFTIRSLHEKNSLAGSPDGVVVLSKIGYSADGKQALVYSLFLSYMANVRTSATLFLFVRERSGEWKPKERVTLLEMGT